MKLESDAPVNNLLAGRKNVPSRDASKETKDTSKENPIFARKNSEKDLKFRKSVGKLKTTSSKTALIDSTNKPQPIKQNTSIYQINSLLKGVSPSNAATNRNTMFNPTIANQVVIHVCDEGKKKTQDFKCERELLMVHMKYFEKYLADQKCIDDLDISVHCDIHIFEWLMNYVHSRNPALDIKLAVSILISSDFLQMAPLVQQTSEYIAQNLQDIINLPIDMSCINA